MQKFNIDIEDITIGEVLDAQSDGGKLFDLMSKHLADDMGTPISEEAGIRILRSKTLKEFNAMQVNFFDALREAQTTGAS